MKKARNLLFALSLLGVFAISGSLLASCNTDTPSSADSTDSSGTSGSSDSSGTSTGDSSTSEEPTAYTVTVNYDANEVTVSGFESSYEPGSEVTFIVTKAASLSYKLVSLSFEGVSIYNFSQETGAGAFVMPRSNVTIDITLVDKASYNVTVDAPEQVVVSGLESSYAPNATVTFSATVNDPNYAISEVTATGTTIESGAESGTYTFVVSGGDVAITITVIQLSADLTGEGTQESPYIISNSAQLISLSEKISDATLSADGYYELANDIDLVGAKWTPIGTLATPFTGSFDGNGHTIKGLKITEATTLQETSNNYVFSYLYAGLFAETSNAAIRNLDIEGATLDIELTGDSIYAAYVGGLVASGNNTYIENCGLSFDTFEITAAIQDAYGYVGGIAGYISSVGFESNGSYIDLINSSFESDITVDTTYSDGFTAVVGGIVGVAYTSNGNIISINNVYYLGSISGGTSVGGIVGTSQAYFSILNSYAVGKSIIATDTTGSYAGGIIGQASYENLIMNTFASYETITAPFSTSTYYKSYAGIIAGYYFDENYGYENYTILSGTGLYNNYYDIYSAINADNWNVLGTSVDSREGIFTANLHYSDSVWDLSTELPTIKEDPQESYEIDVTLDSNGGAEENVTLSKQVGGTYSVSLIQSIFGTKFTLASNSFNGFFYDEAGTVMYRWYAPIMSSTTLYAKYTDMTSVLGTYTYECLYYGEVYGVGTWHFDEDYFYWINDDNEIFTYEYQVYENYIVTGDYVLGADGVTHGDYYDQVLVINSDGTLTILDNNDSDAVYTGTKSTGTWTKPDYTGKAYLGTWYLSDQINPITLYYDGSTTGTRTYTSYDGSVTSYSVTGAFRETDNVLDIYVSMIGLNHEQFTYDSTNDILIGADGSIGTRDSKATSYATSDGTLHLHIVGDKAYIIENGAVTGTSYTGTLEEGGTITINGTSYVVEGSTLTTPTTPVDPDPVDPEPSTDIPWYCGTWEGRVGVSSVTIVLNSDLTGSYNGTEITYTIADNVITFNIGSDYTVTITLDETNQAFSNLEYTDGYDPLYGDGFTQTAKETTSSGGETSSGTYVGTWKGTVNGNSITIVINEDGTGLYGSNPFTYTVTDNVISGTCDNGDVLTLTYDSSSQTLSVDWTDEYEEYGHWTGTYTDYTPLV